jgi:hypothetical protein
MTGQQRVTGATRVIHGGFIPGEVTSVARADAERAEKADG